MDPVMIEKLHALKRYKSRRNRGLLGFLLRLLRLALAVVALGLFLSCPLWIPRVVSFAQAAALFLVTAPSLSRSALVGPACLFVLCNVIVVLLVGESKLGGEKDKVVDIYDEYARRVGGRVSRDAAPAVAPVRKAKVVEEEEVIEDVEEEEVAEDYFGEGVSEDEMEGEEVEEEVADDYVAQQDDDAKEDDVEEEEVGLDELNKKFENFIAYTQRRWEKEQQEEVVSYRSYRGWAD